MENEKVCKQHHMCDWCGNEYGRKYQWWRLILAILIGLFIFLAGVVIGQMRLDTYGEHGGYMMRQGQTYRGDYMMGDQEGIPATTTIVVPADSSTNSGHAIPSSGKAILSQPAQ